MARIPEWSIEHYLKAFILIPMGTIVSGIKPTRSAEIIEQELQAQRLIENRIIDTLGTNTSGLTGTIRRQLTRVAEKIGELERELADASKATSAIDELRLVPQGELDTVWLMQASTDALIESMGRIIQSVKIYAYHIDTQLKGMPEFRVERIPHRSSRLAPYPRVGRLKGGKLHCVLGYKDCWQDRAGRRIELNDGYQYIPNTAGPSVQTQIVPMGLYADLPRKVIIDTPALRVETIGTNPQYGKRKIERGEELKAIPQYVLQGLPIERKGGAGPKSTK